MGSLVNGKWVKQDYTMQTRNGRIKRSASLFRSSIDTKQFSTDANRYHLYACYACS